MKVFLSWAGKESEYIAETLKEWLPQVIQSLVPWMSTHIDKGDAWDGAIADGLNDSPIGILCLTKDSIQSTYLHYEAGAIANVAGSKVCTFLFGIKNSDVRQPLGRFQHTKFEKEEVFKLLKTINEKLSETGGKSIPDSLLIKSFNTNWPELEDKLNQAPKGKAKEHETPDRELLEEILNTVRNMNSVTNQSISQNTKDKYEFKLRPLIPIKVAAQFLHDFMSAKNISLDQLKEIKPNKILEIMKSNYPEYLVVPSVYSHAIQRLEPMKDL